MRQTPPDNGGVTVGVLGGAWRGRVNPWGAVIPADGSPVLDWSVAADDRWHVPTREKACRQRLLDGAPVVETALRVPGGDALHRVYAVSDGGGLTVVEIENRSPSPFAVVLSRRDLLMSRRQTGAPASSASDDPPDGLVLPVAHGSATRVAIAHDGRRSGTLPAGLPSAVQVAKGWVLQTSHGVRLELPAVGPTVALTTLRSRLLLEGPAPVREGPAFLVSVAELCRLGDTRASSLAVVVSVAERLARAHRKAALLPWQVDVGLAAAREAAVHAGDRRAAQDLDAMRGRLPAAERTPVEPPDGPLGLAWAQRRVVAERSGDVDLVPAPFPRAWWGHAIEAHGVPVGSATIGLGLRWHGARPALLWEVDDRVSLSCSGLDPSWSSTARSGEVLLSSPRPTPP